jgi:Ran GTPase-activating protein (RanGAP) involved in mRNA processing and transport
MSRRENTQQIKSKKMSNVGIQWTTLAVALGCLASGECAKVEKLYLASSGIDDAGAIVLAAAIQGHGHLKTLHIHTNNIGDEGAIALAAAMGKIERLNLSDNKIGPRGAGALAAAVAKSTTMNRLGLASNHIGDEGAIALAAAMENSESMTALDLSGNKILANGATAFAKAAEKRGLPARIMNSYMYAGHWDWDDAEVKVVFRRDGLAIIDTPMMSRKSVW